MVAVDVGGKSRSDVKVRPGKPTSKLFRSAFSNVVSVGENSAAWAKATSSLVRSTWLTMWVLWVGSAIASCCCQLDGAGMCWRALAGTWTGTDHSRVLGFRFPWRIMSSWYVMFTL
jgi:hypothetical protein